MKLTELQAVKMRGSPAANDTQFMRRVSIDGRGATVICHFCNVGDRYHGFVHLDDDEPDVQRIANWA